MCIIFLLTPCVALAVCFILFYVKHFELQLLYEMCYINKVLLTYIRENIYTETNHGEICFRNNYLLLCALNVQTYDIQQDFGIIC